MEVIKLMYYTDVHIQEVNPRSRVGNYLQDILDKMIFIGKTAKKENCDACICGGDLFNSKLPHRTPHRMMVKIVEALKTSGTSNYIVTGNHDIRFDREDTLPEQPLGVLLNSGVINNLNGLEIKKKDLNVKFYSYPFAEEPDFPNMVVEDRGSANLHILGLHAYASPKGGDLFGTKIHSYEDISSTGHDIYLLGHYHKDQGIKELDVRGYPQNFVNIGSVARGDYGDDNVTRSPKCCLITITKNDEGEITQELKAIKIEAKPAGEVFDLVKRERVQLQEEEASKFAAELEKASNAKNDSDAESVQEELMSFDIEKEVKERTKLYLDMADESAKKILR